MATEVKIAIRRNKALDRVEIATTALSNKLGIPPFNAPLRAKDQVLREQQWYEAIALYLETVADSLPNPHEDHIPDLHKMTKSELIDAHPNLDLKPTMSKEQIIAIIEGQQPDVDG